MKTIDDSFSTCSTMLIKGDVMQVCATAPYIYIYIYICVSVMITSMSWESKDPFSDALFCNRDMTNRGIGFNLDFTPAP